MKSDVGTAALHLLEISRGFSILTLDNKSYYFKHFTIGQMLEFDELEKLEFAKAAKAGIETEGELIDSAIKIGSWSLEKEEKIKSLKWLIDHSTKALGKMSDKSQREVFSKQIDAHRKELGEINEERKRISCYSAEHLSETKRFSRMSGSSLFYDKKFKKRVKEAEKVRLSPLLFSSFSKLSNQKNLLRALYSTYFFDVFIGQSRNPLALFQTDFLNLTIFQKNILSYSNALLNKIKNTQIPDEIYGDPIRMFDYEEPKDGDKKVTHGLDDLKMKMKARGGELKPEDLLS